MSDIVLLTGISGFLGGHIALDLLQSGYRVRGSLRNPHRAESVRAMLAAAGADTSGLDFVTLDLLKDAGWAEAADDARYVIHSASPFVTTMPRDPGELMGPAVGGTERALNAAVRAGAERIVLTSSSVAIIGGRGRGGKAHLTADDWAPVEAGRMTAYGESKLRAERRAWELVDSNPAQLTVINPGFILGPLLDDDPGTSGAIIQKLLGGKIPMAPDLWLHTVDVRDVARVHVAALTDADVAGRRVPTAFESVDIHGLGQVLASAYPALRTKVPARRAPRWLVRVLALWDGDARANLHELGYHPTIDDADARRLLGRDPITVAAAASAMAQSLMERSLV